MAWLTGCTACHLKIYQSSDDMPVVCALKVKKQKTKDNYLLHKDETQSVLDKLTCKGKSAVTDHDC